MEYHRENEQTSKKRAWWQHAPFKRHDKGMMEAHGVIVQGGGGSLGDVETKAPQLLLELPLPLHAHPHALKLLWLRQQVVGYRGGSGGIGAVEFDGRSCAGVGVEEAEAAARGLCFLLHAYCGTSNYSHDMFHVA